jgi:hypothetical protein
MLHRAMDAHITTAGGGVVCLVFCIALAARLSQFRTRHEKTGRCGCGNGARMRGRTEKCIAIWNYP